MIGQLVGKKQFKRIIIHGKAAVFVDWANVHGWEKTLKSDIDPKKLFSYLSGYQEIKNFRLYFGKDTHEKSGQFLEKAKEIGYEVITKPVKYILAGEVSKQKIFIRKCDFDMETCIDVHLIIVYASGHLGREVWDIKRGLFKAQLKNLMDT